MTEERIRLSICIPTYNRAPQLRHLLGSILHQADSGLRVEIAVSDNGSTDDTASVIDEFARAGLRIMYRRQVENLGFDRNMLAAVALAGGDYCWLFGSDDVMEPGALHRVAEILGRDDDPTGISVGSNGYSPDMARRIVYRDHISTDFPAQTTLHGRDAIVQGIGPWGLGYISSIVVRRSAWDRAVATSPVDRYLNGYIHIYVLARALDAHSTWICLPDRLVGWRSGNDSASGPDPFKRTRVDLVGFEESFGGALGRRNPAYHDAMRKVATFYIRSHYLAARTQRAGWRYWRRAIPMSLVRYWRYPAFWLRTLPIALAPRPALLLAQALRRRRRR